MLKQALTSIQAWLPQHAISRITGFFANSRNPLIKNTFIRQFIKAYSIQLDEAVIENPENFSSFNDFFTRALKPGIRPIAAGNNIIVSPADGTIAQLGAIQKNQLIQAKGHYFDLETLLGGNTSIAEDFIDGQFATVYLAPHNYHRVHMPLTGKLIKTIYIPGRLFSVNRMTSTLIPQLYSRNERLICLFQTEAGRMAVILVGALIVGSMQTVWMDKPIRDKHIRLDMQENLTLQKGDELGHFKLGSTVILLFEKNRTAWRDDLAADMAIQVGQWLGSLTN